jgi:hypothetical protein
VEGLVPDRWSYFEIIGLDERDLKISNSYRLSWMLDEDVIYKFIWLDEDANEIKVYVVSNSL